MRDVPFPANTHAMTTGHRDRIQLTALRVECVIGVYAHERHKPQPVIIDLGMVLDTEQAATGGKIADTVDYRAVGEEVSFILRHSRFQMLETAAHALLRYVLAPPIGERRAQVEAATVTLRKPHALPGTCVPSVALERGREWPSYAQERQDFGSVDIIDESRTAGIYRLNIGPGRSIPPHFHRKMDEAEKVLTKGLLCQGSPVEQGTEHRWPQDVLHRYDNPTGEVQSILCIDRPRFIEHDEVRVAETDKQRT